MKGDMLFLSSHVRYFFEKAQRVTFSLEGEEGHLKKDIFDTKIFDARLQEGKGRTYKVRERASP
ncbi:hypothetical protein KSX_54480 [Ktedonospora formicarum]|uniref:Uncharacterized protein n=1 Tax=Ktedonospora formicarum TaxID=2778364 RepID=A0A8J3MW79_9CHLR|nr:hypothetical protein KSX_54480 [Ktedonospora formicarum]